MFRFNSLGKRPFFNILKNYIEQASYYAKGLLFQAQPSLSLPLIVVQLDSNFLTTQTSVGSDMTHFTCHSAAAAAAAVRLLIHLLARSAR